MSHRQSQPQIKTKMSAQESSLGEPSHLKINNMFDKLARIADNLTKIGKEYDVIKEANKIVGEDQSDQHRVDQSEAKIDSMSAAGNETGRSLETVALIGDDTIQLNS